LRLRYAALVLSILACFGLVMGAYAQKNGGTHPSSHSGKTKPKVSGAQLIRARANWFFRQRAYPLSHIPAFARERAWNDFRRMQQQQRQSLIQKYGANYRKQIAALAITSSAPIVSNPWTPIGPQPTNAYFNQPAVSGRVTALVVDPCDATGSTAFLGAAQGGLWKTINGGTTWTPVGDQTTLPSLAVGSLALPPASAGCVGSPSTSKTIYVGTGEENFSYDSYYGAGVLTCTTSDGTNYSCTPDQTLGAFNTSNPLSESYAGPYIGSLAVDPQNPLVLLAAVQGSGSTLPSGIWCSDNGGSVWTDVLPGSGILSDVGTAVAFDQAGYGYAAIGNIDGTGSANGVYKSGTAYTSDCSPTLNMLSNLTSLAGGASAMGRISFSVYSTSTTSSSSDEIFAAVANASDVSSTLDGVYKSTDGGGTWTALTDPLVTSLSLGGTPFCDDQCFYDMPIVIDPHNANVIYAGGSAPGSGASGEGNTLIASTDGGNSWTDVADNSTALNGIHVDAHAIAFVPNGSTVYVGTDGGVWSTANPESPSTSQGWNDLNATLGLTQIYTGMSNNPSGWQYRSFLGSQDNGTQVLAPDLLAVSNFSDSPLAWDDTLSCGDGGVTLVDPLVPSTVYGECSYIPGFLLGIEKSLFNGNVDESNDSGGGNSTFFEASSGIDASDNGSFIPPLAIDPNQTGSTGDAQTLYFGTCRVWQTTNGDSNWNAISQDVTGGPATSPICNSGSGQLSNVLTSIAVAPTDSNEVVTGSDIGHVAVSVNAGQGTSSAWIDVTTPQLPNRYITQVAVDPSNANTLYATFSGFSSCSGCDGKGHVYVGALTTTATPVVVWTDVSDGSLCPTGSGNLPDIPVNSIVIDPSQSGTLYVGTDVGVYMGTLQGVVPTAVTGACWQPLGTDLPNSAVMSLSLNEASRTLIAGTHGRSAWALQLGGLPAFALTSLDPASDSAGGSAFTMTLGGNGFTASSTVNWSGSATPLLQTSPPSGCAIPTCIAVSVPKNLIASGGTAQVSVSDPSETSPTNSLGFTVTSNTPTVTNISPITNPSGNPLNITLQGTNFSSSTTVGLQTVVSALPCSPVTQASGGTATQITASISAGCLQYGGIYFVTANNPPPGGGSSNPSLVAALSPYGVACTGMSTPGCLLDISGSAPPNGTLASATNITTNSFQKTEDTSGAISAPTSDPAIPSTCTTVNPGGVSNDSGDYKSVWFKYTPTSNVTADVDTIGSNYDTILSVWTDPPGSATLVPLPAVPPVRPPIYLILAVALCVFFLTFAFRRSRPLSRRFASGLALAMLAGSLTFLGACGGGGGGGSINVPPPSPTLTSFACNDDIVPTVNLPSQLTGLSLSANTTYYFMVSDWGVPVEDGSGNLTSVLPSGGKLVFNLNAH